MFRAKRKVDAVAVLFATTQADIAVRGYIETAEKMKLDSDRVERLRQCLCPLCFYHPGLQIAGQAFTDAECATCDVTIHHHNTAVPLVCLDCGKKHSICRRCGADLELRTRRRKFNFTRKEEQPA